MENKGTMIFDLDGTICPIKRKGELYEDLIPYKEMVEKIRELKENGFKITIFTARNMKTHSGNIGLINVHTAKIILDWLSKWEIPYDEIIYGKPWPGEKGFYVDDRSIRPRELITKSFEELNKICETDRLV
jgi:capsule biosynthesis phosphatase